MRSNKLANTSVPIHELLGRRWSPRAFMRERPVSPEDLIAVAEAARWAASSSNEQPWRYVWTDRFRDEQIWSKALACLAEKNQRWARNAPVLGFVAAREHFVRNGSANRWAQYDCGAASACLCLQAAALGLITHQMGGFDAATVIEAFGVPPGFTVMAAIALGYQAELHTLDAEFQESEAVPRTRRALKETFFLGAWDQPLIP